MSKILSLEGMAAFPIQEIPESQTMTETMFVNLDVLNKDLLALIDKQNEKRRIIAKKLDTNNSLAFTISLEEIAELVNEPISTDSEAYDILAIKLINEIKKMFLQIKQIDYTKLQNAVYLIDKIFADFINNLPATFPATNIEKYGDVLRGLCRNNVITEDTVKEQLDIQSNILKMHSNNISLLKLSLTNLKDELFINQIGCKQFYQTFGNVTHEYTLHDNNGSMCYTRTLHTLHRYIDTVTGTTNPNDIISKMDSLLTNLKYVSLDIEDTFNDKIQHLNFDHVDTDISTLPFLYNLLNIYYKVKDSMYDDITKTLDLIIKCMEYINYSKGG